jgi:hypothetical protein
MSGALAWHQSELPIFDPVEPRNMPQDGGAWFTVNWLSPAGRLNRQKAFQLDEMETVLRLTAGQQNLYMSQCLLDRPVRRSPFVRYGTHAYVDLDTYRVPGMASLPPSEAAHEVRTYCSDTGTPPPSAIVSSGRGLYAKWYWSKPIGRADVGRMMSVNRALVHRLDRFGADPKATDATRVLRITGSEHAGAKRLVSLLHLEQRNGHTVSYDFDTFAGDIAPVASEAPDAGLVLSSVANLDREARTQRAGRMFAREGWYWAIVEDCRTLARMRWGGTVPKGWRDTFGHVMACQLARIFHPGNLYREIEAHARLMLPADYVARDLAGHCASLMERARNGEGYRYGKGRLIDLLQITPTEERHMAALISDAEKARREKDRQREQRRAAGMIARAEYEAAAIARRSKVAMLRDGGMSWRKIGAALGISEGEARRLAPVWGA